MDFDEAPIIPAPLIFRAAMVSSESGRRVMKKLAATGVIKPTTTPTGRELLNPVDGRKVFRTIVEGN